MSRRNQSTVGQRKGRVYRRGQLAVRVHLPFLQPPQTIKVAVDGAWNNNLIIEAVLTGLKGEGVLPSILPDDYSIRFESPADDLAHSAEMSQVDLPGFVLEKTPVIDIREAELAMQRKAVAAGGWKDMEKREAEEAAATRRELEWTARVEENKRKWMKLRAKRSAADALREASIAEKVKQREERDAAARQHCAELEEIRCAQVKEGKRFAVVREYRRPIPYVAPETKMSRIVQRLDNAITEAIAIDAAIDDHFDSIRRERTLLLTPPRRTLVIEER